MNGLSIQAEVLCMEIRRITYSAAFIVTLGFIGIPAWAAPDTAEIVRQRNGNLLQLLSVLESAPVAQHASVRAQAAPVLAARAAALDALIRQDPGQALSLALASETLGRLAAAFPNSTRWLESRGSWEGPAEHVVFDEPGMQVHHSLIQITTTAEKIEVHFAGKEPAVQCNQILRVTGVKSGSVVAAQDAAIVSGVSALVGSACTPAGVQNSVILLVTFPGVPPPAGVTPQTVYDTFFGTAARSADGYWRETSYGKTSATGQVFGWYTLDAAYTCSQYSQLRDAALRAADTDVYFPSYSRIYIVFPGPSGCGWAGLSTVGCGSISAGDGTFTASTSWLLSNYINGDQGVKLATHEGGHALGLSHARSQDYGTEALGPLATPGTLSEYGDAFSTMGYWNLGHYSAPHKAMLNWLAPTSNIQTVQTNGIYTLAPLEIPGGLQALKVQRGTGSSEYLWLEYRQRLGNYDNAIGSQVYSGALVHHQDTSSGLATNLLDFTPETAAWTDPAQAAGKTWTDPYSNVSFTVQSATASGLTVVVNYGPLPCVPAAPGIVINPNNPSVLAGAAVTYTLTLTNNDSAGCASSTFSLSSGSAGGWVTSINPSVLVLSPGQTASSTITVTVPAGTVPATYTSTVTIFAAGMSFTTTLTCSVVPPPPPLTASLAVSNSVISLRGTAGITVTALSGTNPAAGAGVLFTLVRPGGQVVQQTATASSLGTAVWNYKANQSGSYSVSAKVTYGSQTVNTTPVSFQVR
jgi:M6 family metalloprotease-like protein